MYILSRKSRFFPFPCTTLSRKCCKTMSSKNYFSDNISSYGLISPSFFVVSLPIALIIWRRNSFTFLLPFIDLKNFIVSAGLIAVSSVSVEHPLFNSASNNSSNSAVFSSSVDFSIYWLHNFWKKRENSDISFSLSKRVPISVQLKPS